MREKNISVNLSSLSSLFSLSSTDFVPAGRQDIYTVGAAQPKQSDDVSLSQFLISVGKTIIGYKEEMTSRCFFRVLIASAWLGVSFLAFSPLPSLSLFTRNEQTLEACQLPILGWGPSNETSPNHRQGLQDFG